MVCNVLYLNLLTMEQKQGLTNLKTLCTYFSVKRGIRMILSLFKDFINPKLNVTSSILVRPKSRTVW